MPQAGHQHRRLKRPERLAGLVLLLTLPAMSAGCGARLTPEQRNAVVGERADAGGREGVEREGGQ